MRLVRTTQLQPGMKLSTTLYGPKGAVLLRAGTELRDSYIGALNKNGYPSAYINDPFSDGVEVNETIPDSLRHDTVTVVRDGYTNIRNDHANVHNLSTIFSRAAGNMIDYISGNNPNKLVDMVDLKNNDDYLYQHSVQTAVLAVELGVAMGYNMDKLRDLGMVAMLHDVGKNMIDPAIVQKKTRTKDEEVLMRDHPRKGFEFAKVKLSTSAVIYMAILQHHEHWNGSGYPQGRKKADISEYARVVAVCDTFDTMTSWTGHSPSEAYEFIQGNAGRFFDPDIVNVFCRKVPPYPVGSMVKLSDGREALVVENNPGMLLRPKIKVKDSSEADIMYDMARSQEAMNLTILDIA